MNRSMVTVYLLAALLAAAFWVLIVEISKALLP